jgi:hypothetical protein
MSFAHSNRSGWRMVLGAVSGIETSSLRSSVEKKASPGFTEPTLALPSIGTVPPAHDD